MDLLEKRTICSKGSGGAWADNFSYDPEKQHLIADGLRIGLDGRVVK
jgi:hypothetical protein